MPTLMIQGTTSDAGKSTLVTALCRILLRRGLSVAPFKPQNMALNSAVTQDGGEIGRAQAVQALAAGIVPHTDMNPVLLKPCNDRGAQIIIHGKAVGLMEASQYHDYKPRALEAVLISYKRLCEQYKFIVVEGAGSPAEINLRENDIANMGFAEAVDCPVILIADIERGGVFAHIVGTLELLSASERERIVGLVINRFRGNSSLLAPGIQWLQIHTGKPVLGVLPYIHDFHVEAEDSLNLSKNLSHSNNLLNIIVPALPRISNHTDFDPLRLHPKVNFRFIKSVEVITPADLIILPGTKNVRDDLNWLRNQGWESAIQCHLRYGGKVIGICGGFQMLGKVIHDPSGIEGEAGSSIGLNLLDITTTLKFEKQLRNVKGTLTLNNVPVHGYEIHAGITEGPDLERPMISLSTSTDGAVSMDDKVMGTYLHGIFEMKDACNALLRWAGLEEDTAIDYPAIREAEINRVADIVEKYLDIEFIKKILGIKD